MPARKLPSWLIAVLALMMAYHLCVFAGLAWYAQPVSDDFFYANIFREHGFAGGHRYLYETTNGRFASNALMYLMPLNYGNTGAYRYCCLAAIALIGVTGFAVFSHTHRRTLHRADRFAVFAALYIAWHAACADLGHFYYWLPAVTVYTVPIAGFFCLAWLLPAALDERYPNSRSRIIAINFLFAFLPLSSESGSVLAGALLAVCAVHAHHHNSLRVWRSAGLLALLLLCTLLAASSPGNGVRMGHALFRQSIPVAVLGGAHSAVAVGLQSLLYLLPAGLLYVLVTGGRALQGINRFLAVKFLAVTAGSFLLAEILSYYAVMGKGSGRTQNAYIVMLFVLALVAIRLLVRDAQRKQEADPAILPFSRSISVAVSLWVCVGALQLASPVCTGAVELAAGLPQQFARDYTGMLAQAKSAKGSVARVSAIRLVPLSYSLPYITVLPQDTLHRMAWNRAMAVYCGKESIYADSLSANTQPVIESAKQALDVFREPR